MLFFEATRIKFVSFPAFAVKSHGGCNLKIIMLSAKCTEDNVREALKIGADGFVAKPFAVGSIVERMC